MLLPSGTSVLVALDMPWASYLWYGFQIVLYLRQAAAFPALLQDLAKLECLPTFQARSLFHTSAFSLLEDGRIEVPSFFLVLLLSVLRVWARTSDSFGVETMFDA